MMWLSMGPGLCPASAKALSGSRWKASGAARAFLARAPGGGVGAEEAGIERHGDEVPAALPAGRWARSSCDATATPWVPPGSKLQQDRGGAVLEVGDGVGVGARGIRIGAE